MPTTVPHDPGVADEQALNAFLDDYTRHETRRAWALLRRPRRTLAAFRAARALPELLVHTGTSADGRAVRRELSRGAGRLRTPLHAVSAAIEIPRRIEDFDQGAGMQTLRRKVRAAEKRGITWERVEDRAIRAFLIELADRHERENRIARYATDSPSNGDLLDHDLWLLARAADGTPLLLSVTPVDDGIAALRYFRTLVAGEDASVARYLMTKVLVERLHEAGASHLVDTTISMHLSPGLRHFQRMVGFRLMRVVVYGGAEAATPASSRSVPATTAALPVLSRMPR